MKKLRISFYVFGLIGVLVTQVFLKNKIPENLLFPFLLIFLGFIYIPFIIWFIKKEEKIEIDFYNFRFFLGLISYPIILIGYIVYIIYIKLLN